MLFKFNNHLGLLSLIILMTGCSEVENIGKEPSNNYIINIGGIETDEMTVVTRANAVDAEKQTWLVQPLEQGLDITYGLANVSHGERMEDVAILKLTDKTTTPATYSFNYRKGEKHATDTERAIWHNNGLHYFQGVHVPGRIRYTSEVSEVENSGKAPELTTDQHNDNATGSDQELGNYILLSHYLGMPANYKLTATVERIKLPFRHRLARVVAFVLIDPELNTKLKGYSVDSNGKDDPNSTSIRFCNVKVLKGVKDVVGSDGHHTLTPTWGEARKIVPHFDGELGSYNYKTGESLAEDFLMFVGTSASGKAEELYPTSSKWSEYKTATDHNGYKQINYGKVPVYDIIVRPTYSSWDYVMYDEPGYDPDSESKLRELANVSNSIDFEIELENGLRYEKTFNFDLNANYQTVVYLRISREKVDYDDAGSEIWVEKKNTDAWYGVNNKNGNTLSKAGSSWQRAYTYLANNLFTENPGYTSGVTDGQFYNANTSLEENENAQYFTPVYEEKFVEKLLQAYKGGAHHGDYFVLQRNIVIDARLIPGDFVFTGHLDGQDHTITLTHVSNDPVYVSATEKDLKGNGPFYIKYNSSDDYEQFIVPVLYTKDASNHFTKVDSIPSIQAIMSGSVEYYRDLEEEEGFQKFELPDLYLHRIVPSFLFAGLNGEYLTNQEILEAEGFDIYNNPKVIWEANVHKETNKSTTWVPTIGYRAEVLNTVVKRGTLFPAEPDISITGNVQNCFNLATDEQGNEVKTAVTYNPENIPQYK